MTAEAVVVGAEFDEVTVIASAAYAGGQVIQLADGRAGYVDGLKAVASGDPMNVKVKRPCTVPKAANFVFVKGDEVWWDHSANVAIPYPVNDRDFYLGTASADVAAATTTMEVNFNEKPAYIIELFRNDFAHVPVLTAGLPLLRSTGGNVLAEFSLTAEAQKLDLLSDRSFPVGSKWVLDAEITVVTNADADVGDLNVGVANATHASDADAITEHCLFHFDMGADLNLDAQSKDSGTTVAATDTTIDWAVGTKIRLKLDGRTIADIQAYVNNALVLGSTVFRLDAATGPLKALFHFEKSSNDSPGIVRLDALKVRISEQG
jgi:hypothetical protein